MVVKKSSKSPAKNKVSKKKVVKKKVSKKKSGKLTKEMVKKMPTLKLKNEYDIALDFATKTYKTFGKAIKSIVLFGSSVKKTQTAGSDIDIIIIIDDASIKWNQELIAWYRQELDTLLRKNLYKRSLHINTVKLTTWWEDLMRGDPIVINILRYGETLIDMAGFFDPLKFLLSAGKIKPTPEAIYANLQRAPIHLARSKAAELNSIEGLYWAMVDSAHAALIAANVSPPSPEHVYENLKKTFVDKGKLKIEYAEWYRDLLLLHKKIMHGELRNLTGVEIDAWQERADQFLAVMAKLIKDIV